jgi:ABC-type multidrug transport system permease subunit
MSIALSVEKFIDDFKRRTKDKLLAIVFVNAILVALQFLYVRFRYEYVNSEIPLWYTKPWGDPQLAPKEFLFLIPAAAFVLLVFAVILFLLLIFITG